MRALIGLDCIDPAGEYQNQPDGAVYTMEEVDGVPDIPYVIVHFDHHVEKLEMTVLDARTGRRPSGVQQGGPGVARAG